MYNYNKRLKYKRFRYKSTDTNGCDQQRICISSTNNLFYTKIQWDYRFGSTYTLLPVQIAIPRAIYPNKPPTLGTEFIYKIMGPGGQGYAYTPVTEAYLNFWYIGPYYCIFVFVCIP